MINNYLYQMIVLKKNYPNIYKVLKDIKEEDEYYLELLGQVINSDKANVVEIIRDDIVYTKKEITNYQKLKKNVYDKSIKKVLLSIIEKKKIHLKVFKCILKQLTNS